MPIEIPKDNWPGTVRTVTIGATAADGGFKRIVWMSSCLKEMMAEEFKAVAEREGDPDLLDKIADERHVTTVDELLPWLEEHQHPALTMDPMF